jgi:hypothetical protein
VSRDGPSGDDATDEAIATEERDGGNAATGSETEGDSDANVRRRWLVRLLVGLGIGIPVVVEGATFARLLGDRLFGGGDDATSGVDPTATPTPTVDRVAVGDELLPETTPADTLTDAVIRADDGWTLALTVAVDNTTDTPYALRLGTVHTAGGQAIEGGTTTGQIPPGESRTTTGEWELPASATPDAIDLTALTIPDEGTTTAVRDRVALAKVPVRG